MCVERDMHSRKELRIQFGYFKSELNEPQFQFYPPGPQGFNCLIKAEPEAKLFL